MSLEHTLIRLDNNHSAIGRQGDRNMIWYVYHTKINKTFALGNETAKNPINFVISMTDRLLKDLLMAKSVSNIVNHSCLTLSMPIMIFNKSKMIA